ncbi:MAG: DUF4372 domain-containing protein [Desulfobacterales bacterium]|nr:DUF4372 domain-containing protein [Desulfobacterales bacterium]
MENRDTVEAQLTYCESLRDIECCLRAMQDKLYHMGIGKISRSTLAGANEARDWRIYADFAQILIHKARLLCIHKKLIKQKISSAIKSLCHQALTATKTIRRSCVA